MDFFDQISYEAQKAGEYIAEKAAKAKDFTVATWNAAELRNEIEKHYKAIGMCVYNAHTTEADTAEEIEQHVATITALYEELREKETTRQAIRNRVPCPACNKPIAKNIAYCPHCGTKVG